VGRHRASARTNGHGGVAAVAFPHFGGGGDEQGFDLIDRCGAGLDCAAACGEQRAQCCGVLVFGHGQPMTGQRGAGCGVSIEGIGLALAAPRGAVGTIDFGDFNTGVLEGSREPGAVATGALNSSAQYGSQTLGPLDSHVIASRPGRKCRISQRLSRIAEGSDMNGVQMSVSADDDDTRCCHDGGVPSVGSTSNGWVRTGRAGRQDIDEGTARLLIKSCPPCRVSRAPARYRWDKSNGRQPNRASVGGRVTTGSRRASPSSTTSVEHHQCRWAAIAFEHAFD
jgi:hypothetical protein